MLGKGLIALALLALLPSSGFAQWPRECRGDVARICREVATQADTAILSCLQTNEKRLNHACRKLLQSYGHLPKR